MRDICHFIDIILRFNQTVYRVNEDDGPVQPILVLSNPSSYDITIQANDNEINATSKYTIINTI